MIAAAIYARKSSEDERSAEDGKSIDRQVALARAFAARQGWAVNAEFVLTDDGVSGADFTRAGLVRLLEGARQKPKPFDAVVIMSLDRIGRELWKTGSVVQALHAAGVKLFTYQDGREVKVDNPTAKLLVGVGAFAAEEYRHAVRLKTAETLREKAKRGHATGPAPYGYTLTRKGEHSEYAVDPEQAAVVQRIFEMSAEGLGDDRIRNRLGGSWKKPSIRRLLANPICVGRLVYGKLRNVDDGGNGTRERVPESEWVTVEVPALRIVSDELWAQVQARKERTRQHYLRSPDGTLLGKPESGTVAKYLLTGIARCGTCGSTMTMLGAHRRRYFCIGRAKNRAACSNKGGVPMDLLDQAVIKIILDELLSDRERLWSLIAEADAKRQAERESKTKRPDATREVARLQKEVNNLVGALASGKAAGTITAEIEKRESAIALLKAAPAVEPVKREYFLTGYAAFRVMLNRRHPAQVRQVLRKLGCDRIVVSRTGEHTWDFAGEFDAGRLVNNGPAASASWAIRTLAGG